MPPESPHTTPPHPPPSSSQHECKLYFRSSSHQKCVGRTKGRSHSFVLDLFVSFSIKGKRKEEPCAACTEHSPSGEGLFQDKESNNCGLKNANSLIKNKINQKQSPLSPLQRALSPLQTMLSPAQYTSALLQ